VTTAPEGVRVRLAQVADADAIGETHSAAWSAAYPHLFDQAFLLAAAESRRVGWRDSIERIVLAPSVLLVGEAYGVVRAFAHATPEREGAGVAEIRGFFAHPSVWGSGLAQWLMRDLCRMLTDQGYERVVLWTPRDAHQARRFYEKVGFALSNNARVDRITDWATGADAELAEVEYERPLGDA
jgi:GNAT superfamily N-acetyltransferase